jgi:hypothetical protein
MSLMLHYGIQGASAGSKEGWGRELLEQTMESLERTYTMGKYARNKTLLFALAALAAMYMGSSLAPAQNELAAALSRQVHFLEEFNKSLVVAQDFQ